MILDARDEKVKINHSVQIAVVGAGPAGLMLASELSATAPVLVIESGGFEVDEELQELLDGECVGIAYPLSETRLRGFGGSTSLWAGYCAVFDPHDFSERYWIPGSGWPFQVDEIKPYYHKVSEYLNLGELNFDAVDIANRACTDLPFNNESVIPTVWRFGTPTLRISEHSRQQYETSENVTTLIHANVVDIRLDSEHGTVEELVIRTLDGREGTVSAEIFVLACGGIETVRLLLNANTQISRGLGNSSDMVGRCFMEHPHLQIPSLMPDKTEFFDDWLVRGHYEDGLQYLMCVGLSEEIQKQENILNARAHVFRTPEMSEHETPKVGIFLEQAPNPSSRLTLSDQRDSLGMKRIRLDWQLTDLDWKTYEKTAEIVTREFVRIRAVRSGSSSPGIVRDNSKLLYSNHHLGTTRMSTNSTDGVVDQNCLIHDYDNMYVIGGSVFPTVSWANPTFTLLALTLRLAEHLRKKLGIGIDPARVKRKTR